MVQRLIEGEAREQFAAVIERAERGGIPTAVQSHGSGGVLVVSLEEMIVALDDKRVTVEYLPEADEDGGGMTLWVPEIGVYAHGTTTEEARDELLVTVKDYSEYFLDQWPQMRDTDKAARLPYVLRLALAAVDGDDALRRWLFAAER